MKKDINKIVKKILNKYSDISFLEGKKFGIPREIILAIIAQESGGEPNIRGSSGEYGLMQLMPDTGKEIAKELHFSLNSLEDLFDPMINIKFGTYYLSKMKKMCADAKDKDPFNYLAAYNGGFGRREKSICQEYKLKVLAWYKEFLKGEGPEKIGEVKK